MMNCVDCKDYVSFRFPDLQVVERYLTCFSDSSRVIGSVIAWILDVGTVFCDGASTCHLLEDAADTKTLKYKI